MKIIVVTPAVPHPFGDTAARWFYVLTTELAVRGHEVVVLSATEESDERVVEARKWLSTHAGRLTLHSHRLTVDSVALRRKWRSLVRPGSELLQDTEFAAQLGRELTQGYDILHLEQMATGWLGLNVPRALLNVHYFDVIDWGDRENMNFQEHKALWQAQRATKRLLHGISNIRLLTPRLREMAESINPEGHYWVVPFALDTSLYEMQPMAPEPVVGMIGSMHWEPSRSAAERLITRIWPLVKRQLPKAKLYIAGWNADKYLRKHLPQADLELANNLGHPVEFFGKAAVMVYAPSRGSGMKVKVMESMAYGVPVVTTSEGVEGIEYRNGQDCWVAETDQAIAAQTVRLLQNATERAQMRESGRALIESRYSRRPVVDQMMGVYEEVLSASETRSGS